MSETRGFSYYLTNATRLAEEEQRTSAERAAEREKEASKHRANQRKARAKVEGASSNFWNGVNSLVKVLSRSGVEPVIDVVDRRRLPGNLSSLTTIPEIDSLFLRTFRYEQTTAKLESEQRKRAQAWIKEATVSAWNTGQFVNLRDRDNVPLLLGTDGTLFFSRSRLIADFAKETTHVIPFETPLAATNKDMGIISPSEVGAISVEEAGMALSRYVLNREEWAKQLKLALLTSEC